jgi:hypothetical protein
MTTQESEVDVLAAMEDAARRIYVNAETQEDNDASDALLKARAAVAELIESVIENRKATQEFANDGRPENYFAWDASERRVQKALANVGAAK